MSLLTQTQPHITTCNSYKLWAMSLTTLSKSCSNFNNVQVIMWQGKEKQKKEILFEHTVSLSSHSASTTEENVSSSGSASIKDAILNGKCGIFIHHREWARQVDFTTTLPLSIIPRQQQAQQRSEKHVRRCGQSWLQMSVWSQCCPSKGPHPTGMPGEWPRYCGKSLVLRLFVYSMKDMMAFKDLMDISLIVHSNLESHESFEKLK